jgi:hypothetical protein
MRIPKWLFVAAPVGFAVFITIGGWIVMSLWNWLGPELFGLRQVTFWQALGLLVLCRILFGGFGPGGGGRHSRKSRDRMSERWMNMTPEERESLRQSWRGRMGFCSSIPDTESKTNEPLN